MSAATMEPNPKLALTLRELSACQHLARIHITFSLTLACPLKCAHCIVDAGPERTATTMPLAIAERYAAQMPAIARHGICGVSFTGGEPFVARPQLECMSEAADAAGLEVSVVTAAHWARTADRARAVVERFRGIRYWDISFDAHHLPWVGIDHVRHAAEAIRGAGRKVNIRVTYSDPMTPEDRQVMEALHAIGEEDYLTQGMRPVGRGQDIHQPVQHGWSPWIKPCVTQGMVVRYDGTVAPCCLNLVESRDHPFMFGDPRVDDLVAVHGRFITDPLLQLIRALGFGPIREWIRDEGLEQFLPDPLPEEVCELCTAIMHNPKLAQLAQARASEGDVPVKIGVLTAKILGETDMLRALGQSAIIEQLDVPQ